MSGLSKQSNLSASFSAVQGSFWFSCSALMSFSVVLLQSKSFNNTQIGLILALQSVASIIGQPAIATYADHHPRIPLKRIVSAALIAGIAAAALLMAAPPSVVLITMLFMLIGLTSYSASSLINALAMQFVNIGIPINFGVARGIGSLCYAVSGYFIGKLITAYGTIVIVPAHALLMVAAVICVLLFQKPDAAVLCDSDRRAKHKVKQEPLLQMLFKNKVLCGVLLASAFAFFSHGSLTTYSINILQNIGGGSEELGLSVFLMSASELPIMFFFGVLSKHFRGEKLLVFAFLFFFVKAVVFALAPNVPVFLAAQPLQMLGYGLFIPASVYFVNDIISQADKVRGQALIMVASTGVGFMLGNLFGGAIIDNFGVPALLLFCCVLAFLSFLIMILTARVYSKLRRALSESTF